MKGGVNYVHLHLQGIHPLHPLLFPSLVTQTLNRTVTRFTSANTQPVLDIVLKPTLLFFLPIFVSAHIQKLSAKTLILLRTSSTPSYDWFNIIFTRCSMATPLRIPHITLQLIRSYNNPKHTLLNHSFTQYSCIEFLLTLTFRRRNFFFNFSTPCL